MSEQETWTYNAPNGQGYIQVGVEDGYVQVTPEGIWRLYNSRADRTTQEGQHPILLEAPAFFDWIEGMGFH